MIDPIKQLEVKASKGKTSTPTFKQQAKYTGLRAIGNPNPDTDIRHNKSLVGFIKAPTWNSGTDWKIHFMVHKDDPAEDGNPNCPWKMVRLKFGGKSKQEARDAVTRNWDAIQKKYKLHHQED